MDLIKKQLVSILLIGVFLAATIWTNVPIKRVKATEIETPLDQEFIEQVSQTLTEIGPNDGFWMGRDFGTDGEREGKEILMDYWNDTIAEYGRIPYAACEIIDMEIGLDGIDNKLEIIQQDDFYLKIDGDEVDCFPIPCLRFQDNLRNPEGEYTVVETPAWWYGSIFGNEPEQNVLKEELEKKQILYEVEYVLLNDSGGLNGDVVYIDDYEHADMNETEGRIHLIEIERNASDDFFNNTINKVYESGGAGYIVMTTNPLFMDRKNTAVPGVAISRECGERIKQSIKDNEEVFIQVEEDIIPHEGNLNVYCINKNILFPGKYVYLIEMDIYDEYNINPRAISIIVNKVWAKSLASLCFPIADAFIISDRNDDTYFMSPGSGLMADIRVHERAPLLPYVVIPGFTISRNDRNKISNLEKVELKIHSSVNPSVESYNVIGTIPGNSNDIVIVCGHYDSLWGQCAIDNAAALGAVWGIAKYFKDNPQITPQYTLKFIAWGGEEYGILGSLFYVWKHLLGHGETENVIAVINFDTIAQNTKLIDPDNPPIPFNLWVYPGKNIDPDKYNNILGVIERTNYHQRTGYRFEKPDVTGDDGCRTDTVCPYSDTISFNDTDDENNPPLVDCIINFERWPMPDLENGNLLAFWDHRSGDNFQQGDIWDKIDTNDLYTFAEMGLNLTKLVAIDADLSFSNGCSFTQQDLDSDSCYDSVKISFDISTDISAWGRVESLIYQDGIVQTSTYETNLMTLAQNVETSGEITVTLPPNATAGNCEIRVYLKDYRGNEDDFDNTTLYLYSYSNPIADFIWERNENNQKMINFTDQSLPSPDATLVSWNWSFGDDNYSNEQNCSHNYSSVGKFNVTLNVTDSANKTANVTIQVETFNTPPVASFTESSRLVVANTTIDFESESSDVDGSIVNTTWYCGDNTTDYGENIEHSYSRSGFYTISLEVTDDDNETTYGTKSDHVLIVDALVDDDFHDDPGAHEWDTIQEGIDDVGNDSIIYVFNGSYDPIEITKSVALYGESREDVLISGGNPGVKIRYNNVSLNGFNVSNGINGFDVYVKSDENHTSNVKIENCNVYGNSNVGILLNQSSYCSIENCTIKGSNSGVKIINGSTYNVIGKCTISHGTYGVYVSDSSHNYIGSPSISSPYPPDCTFTYNHDAIYLKNADYNFILGCDIDGTPYPGGVFAPTKGISLNDSENNTISTCYIHDMTGKGVYLNDSTWNKIEHSKITENPDGVYFYNSPENLIVQNHFGINSEFAVYLPSNTQNNHMYYNDFFVNGNGSTNQSWDANGAKGAENLWSKEGNKTLTKEGRGEGNYWSDYTGDDNDHDGIGDTPYQINSSGVERNDSYPVMEPYGWYNFTQDSTLPVITNVSATPHTVGFGYNVTIRAMVTDNVSNISIVKVNIVYPDDSTGNYTMKCIGGSLYEYTFTDTWQTGQYNYTIWAMDETYNSNSSGGHHFHVSATATISIATLKDSYSGSQYINITDPPNPPENLTVVGRGLTWNTYYNASSGNNILETYIGPVNYQQDNDTWTPINNSICQLATDHPAYVYGYRTGNNRGLFGVYFKTNMQNDWPVAFTYNRSDDPTTQVIRSKLVGVGYVDPQSNWAYQYLQNVQSSQGQTNDNSITYEDVFTGTDVTWSYGNTELKEEITLSNATKTVLQNHPPSMYGLNNGSSYLVFITKLDHQNLEMYNASGMLTGNITISDAAGVDFKDALGQFKCALPLGEAYELNNESVRQKLTYRIVHLNGNTYLLSGLKISDLNAMTFPVVIDPTLTVYSTSSDGYISNSGTNYNTVRTASSGTVNSSGTFITIGQKKQPGIPTATYYVYRGFVFFNTSALPSNAYLDNATLSLYKKDDYSTTDFGITIQNGQPTYPHNPMQSGDYNKNYYSGNGGTLNTSLFTSGYNAIKMNYLSWINKTGTTKLCLRSSRDISGTTPTGNEYVNVYSNEFAGIGCQPKLVIAYRNQSKIKNTGSTNIKGYLIIQVQYQDPRSGTWVLDNDTINETSTRTINSGNQLALDTIFNGKIRASNLQHGTGTYRVYTAFRDPEGNILKTNTGVELKAWWQFSKT